jgi:hypothetical protein
VQLTPWSATDPVGAAFAPAAAAIAASVTAAHRSPGLIESVYSRGQAKGEAECGPAGRASVREAIDCKVMLARRLGVLEFAVVVFTRRVLQGIRTGAGEGRREVEAGGVASDGVTVHPRALTRGQEAFGVVGRDDVFDM